MPNMSINQLPDEMLQMILLNLQPSDRLDCSLVCRKWAEEVSSMSCLKDSWFYLYGGHMETLVPLLIRSSRQYSNLRINGAKLCKDLELWSKVGRHLRSLELIDCDVESDVFYFIIRHCPRLRSIKLDGYSPIKAPKKLQAPMGSGLHRNFQSCNMRYFYTTYSVTKEALRHILKMMPNLETLWVNSNADSHMQEILPCFLETAHKFTHLDVSFANLSDQELIEALQKLSGSLQVLRVSGPNLTRASYPAINDCKKLKTFFLQLGHDFYDEHLGDLVRNIPGLENLSFSWCQAITHTGLTYVRELPKLHSLLFIGCHNIGNVTLNDLGMIPTLKLLSIRNPFSRMPHIRGLGRLNNLTTLNLSFEIDPEIFDVICGSFPKLEKLDLGSCSQLTDADGVKLSRLEHLRMFVFSNGYGFTDWTFEQGLRNSSMEFLQVDCCRLTNAGLESMAAAHKRFEILFFERCPQFTDEGLVTLLRSEPKLEHLKLSNCSSLKGNCLIELEDICPRLHTLELTNCFFDNGAIRRFKRKRPFVKVLVRKLSSQQL